MAKHIPVQKWLDTMGFPQYLPLFHQYSGVEAMLHLNEQDLKNLGVKNSAHRAHLRSSLVILKEKREKKQKTRLSGNLPSMEHLSVAPGYDSTPDYASLKRQVGKSASADSQRTKSRIFKPPVTLAHEVWYHGSIQRVSAEKLLTQDGDFLVRDSISQPGEYVLTCLWKGGPLHFMVNSTMLTLSDATTKVRYQFEDRTFDDVVALINYHVQTGKIISYKSGAIIKHSVHRTRPLDFYAHKQDELKGSRLYSARSQPNILQMSMSTAPSGSPTNSPRFGRKPKRAGSQPLLSMDDDLDDSENGNVKPSLERRDSLPLTMLGRTSSLGKSLTNDYGGSYAELNTPNNSGQYSDVESSPSNTSHVTSSATPAPVITTTVETSVTDTNSSLIQNGSKPADTTDKQIPDLPSKVSTKKTDACIENNQSFLSKPPPKPSRIPSVKLLKQQRKPIVQKRNFDLYEEDDGRDYSDYSQVTSWSSAGFSPEEEQIYSRQRKEMRAEKPGQPEDYDVPQSNEMVENSEKLDNYDVPPSHNRTDENVNMPYLVTVPGTEMSCFNIKEYTSEFLPANNKPLDNSAVTTIKLLLLDSNPRLLAEHITWIDLDLLMVLQSCDLGLRVNCGLEVITLPQGKQLRKDILERFYCLKLFVALTILVCTKYQDRAKMLKQWISIAAELQGSLGNLFGFAAVMEGLRVPQIIRLKHSWLALKQNHPKCINLYDKLVSTMKFMDEGTSSLPLQHVTVPYIIPVVELMERESWDSTTDACWECIDGDTYFGLDVLFAHLDTARIITEKCGLYRGTSQTIMQNFRPNRDVLDLFRTEMHMCLMWGYKGVGVVQKDRLDKLDQLLMVLSERAEANLSPSKQKESAL